MTDNLKQIVEKITALITKNNLEQAELEAKKFSNNHESLDIPYNLLGIIMQKKQKHEDSILYFNKALEINPKFLSALANIGIAFQIIEKYPEAIENFKKVLQLKPELFEIENNLGKIYLKIEKPSEAIKHFYNCININPLFENAFLNLGYAYEKINEKEKAKKNFKKSIEINPNFSDGHFAIGETYIKEKNYVKAIQHYNKCNNLKKNTRILECYLGQNSIKKFKDEISALSKISKDDRRVACASAYISNQFNVNDKYPFCPNPIDFIYKTNISKYFEDINIFINSLFSELTSQNFIWQPTGKTTINGYGTKGNLSEKKLPFISKLDSIINLELKKYYNFFKEEKNIFIKNWPKKISINSWSNRLKKEGYNISHIHPSGWVSGVFYLQIPKKLKNNEAGIEFSLHGDNFLIINKKIPKKQIQPKVGDIILFPSSLFHKTIPFNSNEERVCIAFDIHKIR